MGTVPLTDILRQLVTILGLGLSREELTVQNPLDAAILGLEFTALTASVLCSICFFGILVWLMSATGSQRHSLRLLMHALGFIFSIGLIGPGSMMSSERAAGDALSYVLIAFQLVGIACSTCLMWRLIHFIREAGAVGELRRWLLN